MPKPRNSHWNPTSQRWEISGRDGTVKVYFDERGVGADYLYAAVGATIADLAVTGQETVANTVITSGTITNLNVPTLATIRAMAMAGQGTINSLNVPTLATLRAVNIAGVGTITDLTVPTLAVLRAINSAGFGTLAQGRVGTLAIGGADALPIALVTGFRANLPAIADVGTSRCAVATFLGTINVEVGDFVQVVPRSLALDESDLGIAQLYIPANYILNAVIANYRPDTIGSVGTVPCSIHVIRTGAL